MNIPITREQAIKILESMPQEESDMNHYLETEAIMKALRIIFDPKQNHVFTA